MVLSRWQYLAHESRKGVGILEDGGQPLELSPTGKDRGKPREVSDALGTAFLASFVARIRKIALVAGRHEHSSQPPHVVVSDTSDFVV